MRPLQLSPFADRRNKAQLESARTIEQERADKRIEDIWRQRVRENCWRRQAARVSAHG